MKYLKNRKEFLTDFIKYKEFYNYKSQDLESSALVKEVLENDITWGGSLLGRLINSTIRKVIIGTKILRINPLLKKLKYQLESLEVDYLNKEKEIFRKAIIYALFENIKKAAMKPEPLDLFLKNGGLIDQLVNELDEINEFPEKEALKNQIEQFRKDLEELRESGNVEIEREDDDEDIENEDLEVDEPKEKFKTSVVQIFKSVISLHNLLNKNLNKPTEQKETTPEKNKFKIGGIYTYTNKNGEKKKAKLISFTNQVGIGNDKQFITKDDVKKGKLGNPNSVFVELLDDSGKSLPNNPTMEVDIKNLSIDSSSSGTGDVKKTKIFNKNEKFIFESIEDTKAKIAYNNLVKYYKSSNISNYVKMIQDMIDGSKTEQKTGIEWAGIIWPTEGTVNSKIIYIGKQLINNLKTNGKPLESSELVVEAVKFSDVAKSISLFCKPILGFKNSPELIKMMEGLSEDIQSIIDSFDSMQETLPRISEEKPKKEKFLSSYKEFMRINESDSDKKGDKNPVFEVYRKNFSKEDESIWIASKEEKYSMNSKFKNIKINIDTTQNVDPIIKIVDIFGDAYNIFVTPQIPSGRPNGRVSQKTWREYKYLGKGTGDWQPDRAPNGPFAIKVVLDKWKKGVMTILQNPSLRKIFANPNLSINGNPGAGQVLFNFINDMLDDDALKDYDAARRKLLTKYFNIAEDKANIKPAQATMEGKEVPKDEVVVNQTVLSELRPFSISKSEFDKHSYLILNYDEDGKKHTMVMYIMGTFVDNNNKKIVAFKYQIGYKDLFKYLLSKKFKSPEQDLIDKLGENGKINIGFFEGESLRGTFNMKTQELNEFINKVELKDKEIKIVKGFILNIPKDKNNKYVMEIVKIEPGKDIITDKMRPKYDKSIGLSDIKEKYNKK
jgi:hypothetical protein